ncbi:ABC transporter ATP-binding protein [Anaerobacillus sp. MEB173]|uniref:ABC transporter ATP-binding protein n=1 Tax=Anaerobacillus sp. MEB173 TaxID=3383345 RepID=UPI003F8F0940
MVICEIKKSLRDFELNVSFSMGKETLVIVGHSGCGKSTTLRAIAGLLKPDSGRILVDDVEYFNQKKGTDLPAEQRGCGFLFQNYALFPHLSVYENIAYGLEARKVPKKKHRNLIEEQLDMLNISEYLHNMPNELSGGQQQRVALARALVLRPKVLLLDEPLSALDVTTRDKVRRELRKTLALLQIPAIVVTHDYEDAISFGQRILVMDQGVVLQEGTPQELIQRPSSAFVADFSGTNYFNANVIRQNKDLVQLNIFGNQSLYSKDQGEGNISLVIHPWDIQVTKRLPNNSSLNVISGKVSNLLRYGNRLRIFIEGAIPLIVEVTSSDQAYFQIQEGDVVYATVDPSYVRIVSKKTG